MEWKKVDKTETTITYRLGDTKMEVASVKADIPHANGIGTWQHTSYIVAYDGVQIKECYSLKDAKEFAEKFIKGEAKV